jgi:aspartyl-tRNA(Asn)/glutamyl-tRNA(Gln) amidotransferase subunit B
LEKALETGKAPSILVSEMGLSQIVDENEIRNIVLEVIGENQHLVLDYKAGKRVFDFFIGQIMKKTRGRANPVITSRILKEELDK